MSTGSDRQDFARNQLAIQNHHLVWKGAEWLKPHTGLVVRDMSMLLTHLRSFSSDQLAYERTVMVIKDPRTGSSSEYQLPIEVIEIFRDPHRGYIGEGEMHSDPHFARVAPLTIIELDSPPEDYGATEETVVDGDGGQDEELAPLALNRSTVKRGEHEERKEKEHGGDEYGYTNVALLPLPTAPSRETGGGIRHKLSITIPDKQGIVARPLLANETTDLLTAEEALKQMQKIANLQGWDVSGMSADDLLALHVTLSGDFFGGAFE